MSTSACDVLLIGAYRCDLVFTGLKDVPELGREIFSRDFAMLPGGALNLALTLKKLGLWVQWAADFGNDFFSQNMVSTARSAGLDDRFFRLHDYPIRRVHTLMTFILAESALVTFVDATPPARITPLVEQTQPRCLLLHGLPPDSALLAASAAVHAKGGKVLLDCADEPLDLQDEAVQAVLRTLDCLTLNEAAALRLTGCLDAESACGRLARLTPLVVLQHSAGGASAQSGEYGWTEPAAPTQSAKPSHRRDDFCAGFVFSWLRGLSMPQCLRAGTLTAASRGVNSAHDLLARLSL